MEELIDVLDENGIKTGEVLPRNEIHKKRLWHRIIVVAIINSNNEILMQQRSANKIRCANMWDISVAGHISSGQDSLSAAVREINEEIGISLSDDVCVKDFKYMFSYREDEKLNEDYYDRQYCDFYILRKNDLKIEDIKMQESEIQKIKFCTITEIKELIKQQNVVERKAVYKELENYLSRI